MWDAPWHWVVLAIVVIALFGYKRLPDAARSLGRSMRIFKTEVKGMSEDDKKRAAKSSTASEEPKALEPPRGSAEAPSANGVSASDAPRAEATARPRPTPGERRETSGT